MSKTTIELHTIHDDCFPRWKRKFFFFLFGLLAHARQYYKTKVQCIKQTRGHITYIWYVCVLLDSLRENTVLFWNWKTQRNEMKESSWKMQLRDELYTLNAHRKTRTIAKLHDFCMTRFVYVYLLCYMFVMECMFSIAHPFVFVVVFLSFWLTKCAADSSTNFPCNLHF